MRQAHSPSPWEAEGAGWKIQGRPQQVEATWDVRPSSEEEVKTANSTK